MAGPWEKYANQAPSADAAVPTGPWAKYATKDAAPVADSLDPPQRDMSWGDAGAQAVQNFGPSLLNMGKDMYQAVRHPVDTANALGALGAGVLSKMGVMDADESAANAVGKMLVDHYGSVEGVKNYLANDPAGLLSDVGTLLSGGALAGARAGGAVGKIARAAHAVGDVIDPAAVATNAAVKGAGGAAKLASHPLGLTTGVGSDAVQEMARAGREGNRAALEQLRGTGRAQSIVDDATGAFNEIRNDRGAAYLDDMSDVFSDTAPLPLDNVDGAMVAGWREIHPTGKTPVDDAAAGTLREIRSAVHQTRKLDDTTPRGLDNLKRRVDAIGQQSGNAFAKRIANNVSKSIVDTIAAKFPEYRTGLSAYAQRSAGLTELEKEFSLFDQNPNTSLRKLLSSLRQNANSGKRGELLRDALAAKRPSLPGKIAGHEMSSFTPRGGVRWGWGAGGVLGPAMGLSFDPVSLGLAAAAASPRVVGELAYGAGRASSVLNPAQTRLLSRVAYQSGKAKRESETKR